MTLFKIPLSAKHKAKDHVQCLAASFLKNKKNPTPPHIILLILKMGLQFPNLCHDF